MKTSRELKPLTVQYHIGFRVRTRESLSQDSDLEIGESRLSATSIFWSARQRKRGYAAIYGASKSDYPPVIPTNYIKFMAISN